MCFRPDLRPGWLASIGAVAVAVCTMTIDGVVEAQDTTLTAVLRRAGAYVSAYKRQLGSVVADEQYVQRTNEPDRSSFTARAAAGAGARLLSWKRQEMTSELLLFVQSGDDQPWIAFRDVFEVDGVPVENRQERLVDLFSRTAQIDAELWKRLVAESARFNIGSLFRNINVPTLALQLLTWADQNRVSFEKTGEARIDGVETWEIRFEEFDPPSLIIGEAGVPIYATGTLWIEPSTGRVIRSEMKTDDETIDLETEVTVHYEPDPRLGILVPAKMTERYTRVEMWRARPRLGNYQSRLLRRDTEIHCEAMYSNFRRFETDVSFSAPKIEG